MVFRDYIVSFCLLIGITAVSAGQPLIGEGPFPFLSTSTSAELCQLATSKAKLGNNDYPNVPIFKHKGGSAYDIFGIAQSELEPEKGSLGHLRKPLWYPVTEAAPSVIISSAMWAVPDELVFGNDGKIDHSQTFEKVPSEVTGYDQLLQDRTHTSAGPELKVRSLEEFGKENPWALDL